MDKQAKQEAFLQGYLNKEAAFLEGFSSHIRIPTGKESLGIFGKGLSREAEMSELKFRNTLEKIVQRKKGMDGVLKSGDKLETLREKTRKGYVQPHPKDGDPWKEIDKQKSKKKD